MSIAFSVLGSGSGGNATLLAFEDEGSVRYVLIDAGLSPRCTEGRLACHGRTLDEIDAIILTHLDGDHFRHGWKRFCRERGVPILAHMRHCRRLRQERALKPVLRPFDQEFHLGNGLAGSSRTLDHDALGTTAYIFTSRGVRLGLATDLGCVPASCLEFFHDLDAIAFESNYDHSLQVESRRPWFLKRRIMGGRGHLSNDESLRAVRAIATKSNLQHIALLHLSRQCNHPRIVQELYQRQAAELLAILTISAQDEPTPLLRIEPRAGARATDSVGVDTGAELPLFAI